MSLVVTTSRRPDPEAVEVAEWLAKRFGLPFTPRHLVQATREECIEVGPTRVKCLSTHGAGILFHPGLSVVRIKKLLAGGADQMCEAMGLQAGCRVLDCTLGLGADAIVASYAVGRDGLVVGVESVPEVAVTVAGGLRNYREDHGLAGEDGLRAAMRRIVVEHDDHFSFLARQAPASYDVVYFDPMFRRPVAESDGIRNLRAVANPSPLSPDVIELARQVARHRVVVKERAGSGEFSRLGLPEPAKKTGRIAYAWIPGGGA